jgi:hypothetical protein
MERYDNCEITVPIFDPLGLFTKSTDEERRPTKYNDLYNRDVLVFIPLDEKDPMSLPSMICQYKENGITLSIISEMASKRLKRDAYFTIYGRYFGPSDWIFQHLGDGEIRTCGDPYTEYLGHVVLMREFDPKKLDEKYRKHFNIK